jgi:hypothetical protein
VVEGIVEELDFPAILSVLFFVLGEYFLGLFCGDSLWSTRQAAELLFSG